MQMVLWGVVIVGPGSCGGLWGTGVLIAYPCKTSWSYPSAGAAGGDPVDFSTCALTFSYILFPFFIFIFTTIHPSTLHLSMFILDKKLY